MAKKNRWLRCEMPFAEVGDFAGRLVRELAIPFALAGGLEGVAIYKTSGMMIQSDRVSVWLTEKAAELADHEGIEWRSRLVDSDAPPPELGKVAKLLGQEPEMTDLLWEAHGEQ